MKVLIDETSSPKVAASLRALGLDVIRVGDDLEFTEGSPVPGRGSPDRAIAEFCHHNMVVWVTCNLLRRDQQMREALAEFAACAVIVKPQENLRHLVTALLVVWDELIHTFDDLSPGSDQIILRLDPRRRHLSPFDA